MIIQFYLTGLSGIFPSFIPPVEAVRERAVGVDGRDGVVVDEASIVTTVVEDEDAERKDGMVTSWASEASSPQWGQKSMPPSFGLLRPLPKTVTQPRWKRWAMRWSGQHSRNVPCKEREASDINVLKGKEILYRMNVYCMNKCSLTAKQKNPQPGQQWCWTICDRWTSQSTMRGTRLDGRIVSPFIVRLVQALN